MAEYIITEHPLFPYEDPKPTELVRCKDCKYHEDEEPGMVYCPQFVGGWVENDFFCADGEKRENAEIILEKGCGDDAEIH